MAAQQQPAAGAASSERSAVASLLRELLEVIVLAVILYVGISFAVQAVHVEGLSMWATLDNNDYLIANKVDYRLHAPQRGDIIILRPPTSNSTDFIKRVIALPGEKLLIRSGVVYINGHRLDEPYLPEAWVTDNNYPTNGSDGEVMPPNDYFVMGDNRNRSQDSRFFDRLDPPEKQLLVREPEGHAVGRLELEPQATLGELLGPRQLLGRDLVFAETPQLPHHRVHRIDRLLRIDPDVHADVAGVAMLLREAVHVISKAKTLANVQEEAGAHALAEHGVEKVQRVAVRMDVAESAHAEADVRLLRIAPANQHARTGQLGRRQRRRYAIQPRPQRQTMHHFGQRPFFVERSRRSDDQVGQPVVGVCVLEDVFTIQAGNRFLRPCDVAAQRMVGPDQLFEEVLDVILRLVLVHPELFQDHHPLALDIGRIKSGVGHDVEEDVQTEFHVLGRDARPVGGELFVGGCVDESANALDRVGDLLRRRPPVRSLEIQVLDEVRHAGETFVLEPRASGKHQHDARRMPLRHRLDHHACSPIQLMDSMGRWHGLVSIGTAGPETAD